MQTRTLPHSIEAEMSVLGSVFVENAAIHHVLELLQPTEFYRESHRKILDAMIGLASQNEPIDLVTVSDALKKKGELQEVGGAAYLAVLVDYVPTSANVGYYCKIVKEKAFGRQVIKGSEVIREAAFEEDEKLEEKIETLLTGLNRKTINAPVSAMQLTLQGTLRLEKRFESKGKIQGIPYGIPSLDQVTSGMHRGELIIVAGRPSMGKSAFAGNITENVCSAGYSAMFFSLEMDTGMIFDRLAASAGNVRYENIRSGNMDGADWSRLTTAFSKTSGFKLLVDDTPAISLREVRAKCTRQKSTADGLDLVVVDYIQLMDMEEKESRAQAIGQVSRGLKRLARELECPVIALSQLNRGVDSRTDKRPTMSDLRDSGEIEQDADVILFPFRPAAYCQDCRDKIDNDKHDLKKHQLAAEIIIEKQRNGERNLSVPLVWIGKFQRFEETNPFWSTP